MSYFLQSIFYPKDLCLNDAFLCSSGYGLDPRPLAKWTTPWTWGFGSLSSLRVTLEWLSPSPNKVSVIMAIYLYLGLMNHWK